MQTIAVPASIEVRALLWPSDLPQLERLDTTFSTDVVYEVQSELLAAAEGWAQQRGYRFLTLNVFAANERARAVYERAGFALDTLRYYKELRPGDRAAPPT